MLPSSSCRRNHTMRFGALKQIKLHKKHNKKCDFLSLFISLLHTSNRPEIMCTHPSLPNPVSGVSCLTGRQVCSAVIYVSTAGKSFLPCLARALHPEHGIALLNAHRGELPPLWKQVALKITGQPWLDPIVTPMAQAYK